MALKWSFRRIERETGVRRETISRYAPEPGPNPAKTFPGSEVRPCFAAAAYHDATTEKLELGLTVQRIFQDLVEGFSYGNSYESVKRYVRTLHPKRRACGVMHSLPGEEAQVDFFQGPPTLDGKTGQWRRPWVFRMTVCHSRHGYEEAVWDQKLESFLALHENALRNFGGVPSIVRHDNMNAAVVRACFYDPDVNPVWTAFAQHWGFTALPTLPANPKENGKQERSGVDVITSAPITSTFRCRPVSTNCAPTVRA